MIAISVRQAYALTKPLLEHKALSLRARNPWLHLADACTLALQRQPACWRVYRAAMRAGLPSEFQRGRRPRAIPTPKDRAWQRIEMLARTLVAASTEPLTLRNAVMDVVRANPDLYRRYINARSRA